MDFQTGAMYLDISRALLSLIAVISLSRTQREQQRSQAEKIAAWGEEADGRYKIIVRNQSDLPVTALTISFNAGFKPLEGIRLSKNPRPDRHVKPRYINVLSPGTMEILLRENSPGPVLVTALSFRDSRDVRWIRTETGLRRSRKGRVILMIRRRRWLIVRRMKILLSRIRISPSDRT